MRPGTPGFSGGRLREARGARALSVISLAEIAGVSTQAIYQYEKDRSSPGPEVLSKISAVTNLLEAFFLQPERPARQSAIYFRSMTSATKSARRRADSRLNWVRDIVAYTEQYVSLPNVNFPEFDLPKEARLISDGDIDLVADELRSYWRLGEAPIANMISLLENQGAVVARGPLGAETLDGVSTCEGERPFIFIGTDKGTPARWRFDAAHELGHIVLHHRVPQESFQHPELHKRIEQQAHRFAASFLLPLAPFGEDLFAANLDVLRSLKPKWKTSIAMMITQAMYGGYITDDVQRKLWISMSRRKWRQNEPLDDTMEPEYPRLLRRSLELILDEGAQTAADIVNRLRLSPTDIETLVGFPEEYLANHSRVRLIGRDAGNVISLLDRRRSV